MRMRGLGIVKGGTLIGLLVAVLFALSIPLSNAVATMGQAKASTMSCHDQGTNGEQAPKPDSMLQHLCCFTACIPMGIADADAAFAMPTGELVVTLRLAPLVPLVIGIDPPPPKV